MESPARKKKSSFHTRGVSIMSSINRVGHNTPVQKILSQPIQEQVPADAPKQVRSTDKVELSGVAHLLKALKSNDVRADKVAAIKAQIDAGTYEDDHKLDVTTDRLLDDLLK